ncbi:helix-turn-helix domain-containing protein [Sphingomonas sanxanigenens]|uniref:HTH cro/C1-type domain-containing protein n=1 Tax=Sphingomonas sanxanigenens DSM 19645 = NX02 TaxID=1123269 RepID=W0AAC9_9SPHN|nr:helix-turn-helix transcriptional regulator [Sphingomonas sanxanigenens]AHE52610.1 hypothetical protein NX02_04310 [Sphingomonas sanxanigenens DSM 19645 = NX02]
MTDIRDMRRRIGVTQTELAALLGLNQSTISRFEGGSLPVDDRTLLALEALIARAEAARPTALCTLCERRTDDPAVNSCTATDCPCAAREAA